MNAERVGTHRCRCRVRFGAEINAGGHLYRQFNQFQPDRTLTVRYPRVVPPVVVQLGELVGVIYRSDKWHRGSARTYVHFMEQRPRLVSNPAGTQLYVVGGSYRVTPRGIEG